ncbi:sugar ABC transporter permease [Sphaerisporangium siamense]|uniref:Ribose transport system permease protein n=1 Tax=Sphaerisporangium siamense TaxID=795645 RepID=A0A7W7DDT1_9ACTN|nr:ABC transporter permease [Sphaerisporangium siamense]MBB4703821.1 ribose transport system permease protein [Sphaerisporangium siamense]GII82290.1 sugar ABC transporter permease [Sphaerisporangium siamense]
MSQMKHQGGVAAPAPGPAPGEAGARPDRRRPREGGPDWQQFTSRYAIVGIWILMCAFYAVLMPDTFLQGSTFRSIFASQQALVFLAMAAMMTFVVGEFDLSIASALGLSATLVPVLAILHGWNLALACVVAVLAAALGGLLNGFLVVKVGVPALIVTLGSSTLMLGIASLVSHQTTVSGLSSGFADIALYEVAGLPISFFYGLALALVIGYVLTFTPLGRHMTFVGANREVARLAGVAVNRIRLGSFVVGSTLAGIGGVLLVASVGGYDSTVSPTYLLPAFAATFLGTAVVRPGRHNPIGTMVAIYFLATGILGLQMLGYTGWIENVFYGTALIIAVSVATIVRRRTAST